MHDRLSCTSEKKGELTASDQPPNGDGERSVTNGSVNSRIRHHWHCRNHYAEETNCRGGVCRLFYTTSCDRGSVQV